MPNTTKPASGGKRKPARKVAKKALKPQPKMKKAIAQDDVARKALISEAFKGHGTRLSKSAAIRAQLAASAMSAVNLSAAVRTKHSRFRSAITGLFVSMAFALRNASTTIREALKR